ncbi:MAG: CRISPR-associated endonuclease Cas2 [Thermotogae bacterium]|nr:CRISPR-associated endonuclease Cas2 [Thermotogota bacterium]
MWVILVYDVATEDSKDQQRLTRIRKIVRRYLTHVQKSVFEGEITASNLEKLKAEVLAQADRSRDSIILYIFDSRTRYQRQILTHVKDPIDNII